jgi:hypothetical protein
MGGRDMDRCGEAAAKLPESERKDLAILALARSQTVSELASQHEVSRNSYTSRRTRPGSRWMMRFHRRPQKTACFSSSPSPKHGCAR